MAQHPNYQPVPMGLHSLYTDGDNNPYSLAVEPPVKYVEPQITEFEDREVEAEDFVDITVTEDCRKVINFNAWLKHHDSQVNAADIQLKLVRELDTETIEDLIESVELSEVEITRVTIDTTRYKK